MSIRSFPNEITNNDTELKTLRKEIKKLTIDRSNLEKLKQQLSLQLQETNSKIEKLLSEKKKFESEILMDGGEQVDKDEQLDRHLAIKEYQIQCMEMTLMSKSFIHDFDIQQLKTEIARLNTMLDIKDFSSEDIARNSKKVELDYERLLSQVQQRIQDHSNRLEEMHKMERELQNKLNRTELNSPIIEHKEISTEIDKKIPTQDDIEELEDIQMEADKELDRKIENVRDELSRVDQKLEESIRQRVS
jgi:chromosome segregation ATPase